MKDYEFENIFELILLLKPFYSYQKQTNTVRRGTFTMHSASVHHNINKYYQIESNYIFERTRMRFRNFSQSTSLSCREFSPAKRQAAAGGSTQPGCGGTYTRWAEN